MAERKADARNKIALGGLLKLSDLWDETDQVVLSAMRAVRQLLDGPDGKDIRTRFLAKGRAEFNRIEEEKKARETQQAAPEEVRRERNHVLISRGALVIKAGLNDEEERVILGGMLSAATRLKKEDGESKRAEWQAAGDAEMPSRREKGRAA